MAKKRKGVKVEDSAAKAKPKAKTVDGRVEDAATKAKPEQSLAEYIESRGGKLMDLDDGDSFIFTGITTGESSKKE